jgi:hypothetical protein
MRANTGGLRGFHWLLSRLQRALAAGEGSTWKWAKGIEGVNRDKKSESANPFTILYILIAYTQNTEMAKILVCGDVNGELDAVFSRVATLSAKSTFDLLLCVGNFFRDDGSSDVESYINGEKIAPIETYFIVGGGKLPKWWDTLGDRRETGGPVCAGIHFLGKAGFLDIHGVSIGFISGTYSDHDVTSSSQHFGRKQIKQLLGSFNERKAGWVDVLMTADWGQGLHRHVPSTQLTKLEMDFVSPKEGWSSVGCPMTSTIARQLCPRYHFASSQRRFFERQPYSNSAEGTSATRFLALGEVPAAGAKAAAKASKVKVPKQARKWLYAMRLVPWVPSVSQAGDNSTPSPYEFSDAKEGGKESASEGKQGAAEETAKKKKAKRERVRSRGSGSAGSSASAAVTNVSLPSPDELFANVAAPSYAQVLTFLNALT